MPDIPADTVIVNIPIDADSLPQYVIIRFTKKGHNFAPLTNQAVINLFAKVFKGEYGEVIARAGLGWLATKRGAVYDGPDIEQLTLGEDERRRIIEAM